jgi:hypothetical protein
MGLLKSYLQSDEPRYAVFAALCLNIAFGSGMSGLFYAMWAIALLFPLLRLRILPIVAGVASWVVIVTAGNALHWAAGLASLPFAFGASALAVCWCHSRVSSSEKLPQGSVPRAKAPELSAGPRPAVNTFDGRLAVAITLLAAVIAIIAASGPGYGGYWWYNSGRSLTLYSNGCGIFLVPAIAFLVYVAWKKTVGADAILLSAMCATALLVPVLVMSVAPWLKLPHSVPGVIFYEIGRVTSLYFLPVALCLTGAEIVTVMYQFVVERHAVLGYACLIATLTLLIVPTPIDPEADLGGWERMAFRSGFTTLSGWLERAQKSASMAKQLGPDRGFSPYIFGFGLNEIRMTRDLAEFGGPSNRCLFVLMRGPTPREDPAAEGFFAWGELYHLFPYERPAPAITAFTQDSACVGKETVLVPKSDYDLIGGMPPALNLRREPGSYRIYSELP